MPSMVFRIGCGISRGVESDSRPFVGILADTGITIAIRWQNPGWNPDVFELFWSKKWTKKMKIPFKIINFYLNFFTKLFSMGIFDFLVFFFPLFFVLNSDSRGVLINLFVRFYEKLY